MVLEKISEYIGYCPVTTIYSSLGAALSLLEADRTRQKGKMDVVSFVVFAALGAVFAKVWHGYVQAGYFTHLSGSEINIGYRWREGYSHYNTITNIATTLLGTLPFIARRILGSVCGSELAGFQAGFCLANSYLNYSYYEIKVAAEAAQQRQKQIRSSLE